MNIVKFSIAFSIFAVALVGCNSEDDVVPEIAPTRKAEEVKVPEDSTAKADSMPELKPIQSLSVNSSTSAETFTTGSRDIVEPGSAGSVTIQVSIQPSKRSASAILGKLEEKGIKGYLAQVENPGELEGSYYRVRVGYFKKIEEAKAFGKNRLEPLGFAWWIDNKANDAVGSPETGEPSSAYGDTPTAYTETQAAESIPTDAEIPEEPAVSSSSEVQSSSSEAVEIPPPEPQPLEESAQPAEAPAETLPQAQPATSQAPAETAEEVYDDWE